MEGVDPDTLLEWLQTGCGDERDLQLMALEQLCMLLLMSDNIDRCFESCPPRTFMPALCKVFLDEKAPDNVLEVTARAITYYLDVSNECTRRITQVDGAVKAICNRLAAAEMTDRSSKDLAEQCVKLLEHVCQRETLAVYDAGGLQAMLTLVRVHGSRVHKDTLHSAMSVVTRLCSKMEPNDVTLAACSENLGALLEHDDPKVSECALRCFAAITDRFIRKGLDPAELARHSNLVEHLLSTLAPTSAGGPSSSQPENPEPEQGSSAMAVSSSPPSSQSLGEAPASATQRRSTTFTSIVLSLLSNLCRGSADVTEQVLNSPHLVGAMRAVLTEPGRDERSVTDGLRLADLLVVLICEGRSALPKTVSAAVISEGMSGSSGSAQGASGQPSGGNERAHRHLIDAIRQRDMNALMEAIESGSVDANHTDEVGQTLLNWASAFGSADMVIYLCEKGADVNRGHKSSSLHYAACFGRPDIAKILLQRGANPELRDEDGKTALDKARERSDDGHQQVATILESPSSHMHAPAIQSTAQQGTSRSASTSSVHMPEISKAVAQRVLEELLPVFCDIFQKSLAPGVRRTTLTLLRKTINHMNPEALGRLSQKPREDDSRSSIAESFVNVLMTVLEHEDDLDAQEQVLMIMSSLLSKDGALWLEQLCRLGVFEKVEAMAKEPPTGATSSAMDAPFAETSDDDPQELNTRNLSAARSASSTPSATSSVPIEMEEASGPAVEREERPDESERNAMLNVNDGGVTPSSTATPPPTVEVSTATPIVSVKTSEEERMELAAAHEYKWKEWRLVRGSDSLFIWSDALALEHSFVSNGWFRYLLDGRLATMLSTGLSETGKDPAGARRAFLDRFRAARAAVPKDALVQQLFALPHPNRKAEVPNWEIWSPRVGELFVRHRGDGTIGTEITVKDDLPGFVLESPNGTQTRTAEVTLGAEFATGWASAHGGAGAAAARRARFRLELQRRRVQELAWELWEKHLKEARAKPREALILLQKASKIILDTVKYIEGRPESSPPTIENVEELSSALRVVAASINEERLLSTFELSVSGLVPALCALVTLVDRFPNSYSADIFKQIMSGGQTLSRLVRALVAVLESAERFPQYLYDTPGGSAFGLQLLNRRIRAKLELITGGETDKNKHQLLDRSGRVIKSEPLTSVGQLKSFVLKMVAKQWYDRPRETFSFLHQLEAAKPQGILFTHETDFDEKGVIYWLGTNGRAAKEWTNPASVGVAVVTSSDGARQPFGKPEDILSRDVNAINCHTSDDKNANFTIDLGLLIYPSAYTIRHSRGYGRSALRNWMFQGSRDKQCWEVLRVHSDDTALNDPGSTHTWELEDCTAKGPFRYLRIAQNGKNSSGQTCYISVSGFEVYGRVMEAITTDLRPPEKPSKRSSTSKKVAKSVSRSSRDSSEKNPFYLAPTAASSNTANLTATVPQGTANNRFAESQQTGVQTRSRTLRSRSKTSTPTTQSSSNVADPFGGREPRGLRVVRGPDWKWDDQDGHGEGRIISNTADNGWVDVRWENGSANSYRMGAGGHIDLDILPESRTMGPREILAAMRQRGKGLMSGVPAPRKTSEGHSLASSFSLRARATDSLKKKIGSGSVATPLSRFAGRQSVGGSSSTSKASTGDAAGSSSTNMGSGKKSMSTTDLHARPSGSRPTVSATGQAASAESLQHQTPSLENLLARSRVFNERIVESADESPRAEVNVIVEPASVASGTVRGGSQPELSLTAAETTSARERDVEANIDESVEDDDDQSLSVSAPDLAAARARQQSADTAESSAVEGGGVAEEDEDEEDEEEDDDEDENENEAEVPVAGHRPREASTDSHEESFDLLLDPSQYSGDTTFLSRLRRVMDAEDPIEQLMAAQSNDGQPSTADGDRSSSTSAPAASNAAANTSGSSRTRSSGSGLKQRLGNYADIIKNMMHQMMDPGSSLNAMEVEEIDEEDMYDDEMEGNEEEMEEELSALGVPVETFASILGRNLNSNSHAASNDMKFSWRQLSHVVMSEAASRLLEQRSRDSGDPSARRSRGWDDEFVLKCTFQALIPAFDPRPGRTNVNQTQDVELPANISEPTPVTKSDTWSEPSLRLFLRGPNLPTMENVTVEMDDDEASFFYYLQRLVNLVEWSQKGEKSRRIWEPTYTLLYEDGSKPSTVETSNSIPEDGVVPTIVTETLEVLRLLSVVGSRCVDAELSPANFSSEKLSNKLHQELSDSLVVAARAIPRWCSELVYLHPYLFSTETRNLFLQATGYGVSRSIVWLQSRRDAALERTRGAAGTTPGSGMAGARREDHYPEYRVGRLKHERIKIVRSADLLGQAQRVMKWHAERKAVLEIQYADEEGTGLGPTLEFYALVAAEYQRKSLALWLCDDLDESQLKLEETELDLGEGKKPPGYYVRRPGGLFPAPLPPDTEERRRAAELFRTLGVFLAKVLQDGRLVDLPLAQPFLKLIVSPQLTSGSKPDLSTVLGLDDFEEVHPVKGKFLKELSALSQRKRSIETDGTLPPDAKRRRVDELTLCINGTRCKVDDLALSFSVNPPSAVFAYDQMELCEGGADLDVTMENVDLYVDKCTDFYLNSGISDQVIAFRDGFNRVFPLKCLQAFSPEEVQRLLSGDQCPEWTRDDILAYTEPKLGYNRDSPGFLRFVDVLVGMSASERKSFLQFTTGCSSLPPGGLANLHPRLTVVRKVESGDGSYPSVNTCVHYLKLPEYSSAEILRERLLTAVNEKGFHLN